MERQLALKGICSVDEWHILKEKIHYDFLKDNNFMELKESELMMSRLQTMQLIDPYVGTYFSKAWIKKHVLRFDEEGMKRMDDELAQEATEQAAEQAAMAQQNPAEAQQSQQPQGTDINAAFSSQITK